MQRYHRLEDVAWGSGANRLIKLDSLPPGMRVREIVLFFDLSGTKLAADALDGQLFAQAVSLIKVGQYVNIPGWELQQLQHQVYGRVIEDPADIPGVGVVFDMEFSLRIPFRDPRQPQSDDGSIPTELLHQKAIELTFAAANVWSVGSLVVTAGAVRAEAELVHETDIPQLGQIGYEDPGSLTIPLRPGVLKDLFIVDGATPGSITRTEIASLDLEVDGEQVWNNALHEQVVAAYNGNAIRDGAAEIAHNSATRLPLVWHDRFGKANISKQPAIESAGRIQITGTITSPRIVYWRALPKDKEAVVRIAQATGAPPDATDYEPATASKKPLRAFERTATTGRTPKKARILGSVLKGKVRRPGTANR